MAEADTLSVQKATDIVTQMLYDQKIHVLGKVLEESGIPKYRYSFEGEREDTVSLMRKGDLWEVTYVERANRDTSKFEKLSDACKYLIFSVSDNDSECNAIKAAFDEAVADDKTGEVSRHRILDLLKKAASQVAVF